MSKSPKTNLTLEGISNDLHKLINVNDDFPLEVFPEKLQLVAREYSRATGAPICFLGGAMLTVAGVALGNSARLTYGNYTANGVMFLCVIGRRGTGKSHPLDFILNPLKEIDSNIWKSFKNELSEWEQEVKQNPKSRQPEPAQPSMTITTDATPEGLVSLHENNSRSLLIHRDELSGLVASFDQYSKGGESQKYLQIWNGQSICIARKGSGMTRIDRPHISILGGIQPEILPKLAEKSRISDGFLDRFLFCYPASCIAQSDSMEIVDSRAWRDCVTNIYAIQPNEDKETSERTARLIRLSAEAQEILTANNEVLRGIINSTISDLEDPTGGIAAKLRIYQYRFALILQSIRYGCGLSYDFSEVDEESAKGAVLLADYFLSTALKVHSNISDKMKKSYNIRRVHKLLNNGKKFREIAEIMELSVGTVSNYSKQIP